MESSYTILDLPPEILTKLFSYLPGRELGCIARVCRTFRDTVNVEFVWQRRCLQEFSISETSGNNQSYRDLYCKLLHKWGYLLGTWRRNSVCYGGLLTVKYVNGSIEGRVLLPPCEPHVERPLRYKTLFTIKVTDDLQTTECICHQGYRGSHSKANIHNVTDGFVFECSYPHDQHEDGNLAEFSAWLQDYEDMTLDEFNNLHGRQQLLFTKYTTLHKEQSTEWRKFDLVSFLHPRSVSRSSTIWLPIRPGLFKGTYGGHGVELIHLSYDMDKQQASGLKVTGDPNVPAGQVSIKAYLDRPMVLTLDQQTSSALLLSIDTPDLPQEGAMQRMAGQPFRVPQDFWDRSVNKHTSCRARYHGHGQVAGHNFHNPQLIPGHWVIFDEDHFGFLWIDLRSFSIYDRVKDDEFL